MANWLHDKVFEFLEDYRSSHPDFVYWLRERNTKNRLTDGYWFQGNEDYVFVGLYDHSGGSNKTRSIGLYFFPAANDSVTCSVEVVYNEEKDQQVLKLYDEIKKLSGNFKRIADTRFREDFPGNGFVSAEKFLSQTRPSIDALIKKLKLDHFFIRKPDFDQKLNYINSLRNKPPRKLFPSEKIGLLKNLYGKFKNDDFYKQRITQLQFIPFAKKIITNSLKNELTNETLTGLIQILKNGAKSDTVNYYINKNIKSISLRTELKREFSAFGFTGYTGAGKTGITGLDTEQLERVKEFVLGCTSINTKEEAVKYVESFDALMIPQVKTGVYSPWLYYMNPGVFPIKNNSHDGFIEWCNQPTGSYALAILLFHEVADILEEKDLGLIDAFTHMFADSGNETEIQTYPDNKEITSMPLNTILYGPPGTGKTYNTINKAVGIASPQFDIAGSSRNELKEEYERLVKEGQIEFITFHQSMSYEDFIEGIKPVEPKEGDDFLKYEIKDGIFKRLCERAAKVPETKAAGFSITEEEFQRAGFYKMSLGDTSNPDDDQIYEWCIKNGYIALGRGDVIDFAGMTESDIQQMVPGKLDRFSAQSMNYFIHYAKKGDYVVVTYGNLQFRAVGKITGDYEFKNVEGLQVHQFRKVEWLWSGNELPYEEIYDRQFSQQSIYKMDKRGIKKEFLIKETAETGLTYDSLYKLFLEKVEKDLKEHSANNPLFFDGRKSKIQILRIQDERIISIGESANTEEPIYKERLKMIYDRYRFPEDIKNIMELREISTAISWTSNYFAVFKALKEFEASLLSVPVAKKNKYESKNYILIIDEINRGNVSQIFGELITLIEDDKRAGRDEALTVTLPYSKKPFSVPSNLYIIGTMNTADRSVEALDTALRRRFSFEPVLPETKKITESPSGIDLELMLSVINNRLEVLLSKDQTIGHAWLMRITTIEQLRMAFKNRILPLLQEFFYNDYAKIGLVLGKNFFEPGQANQIKFAEFDDRNELAVEYSEKMIYKLKDPADLTENDFISVYHKNGQ